MTSELLDEWRKSGFEQGLDYKEWLALEVNRLRTKVKTLEQVLSDLREHFAGTDHFIDDEATDMIDEALAMPGGRQEK